MSTSPRFCCARLLGAIVAVTTAVTTAGITGCTSPRQLAYVNDQMNQAAQAVADIRVNMSVMQSSIDSLTLVVAKQDSTIVKLAAVTNVLIVK